MISRIGFEDLNTKKHQYGSIKSLARIPYSRNLFYLMKEFKVLPTEERFQKLSDETLSWLMYGFEIDAEEERTAQKNSGEDNTATLFNDDEADIWLNQSAEDFDPTMGIEDEDAFIKEVESRMTQTDLDRQQEAVDSLGVKSEAELEEEATVAQMEQEAYQEALKDAQAIEEGKKTRDQVRKEFKARRSPLTAEELEDQSNSVGKLLDDFNN